MAKDKDTIYIDIDDEITGIIDKVQGSSSSVVALVLPKRATVFQSIVNMKLLKRAADSSGKNLVLITTEAGLLPLAGAAGVYVAKTLTSKPEIPAGPAIADEEEENVGEDETVEPEEDLTAENAGDVPIGELAGAAAVGGLAASKLSNKDDVETLQLDNEDLPTDITPPGGKTFEPPTGKKSKPKKDKNLKVPNFERFRLLLIIGGALLVALIVAGFFGVKILPKATIDIQTNAVNVDVTAPLTLSTTQKTLDLENNTLPAKYQQIPKTYTQTAATTGQKNNGNKATGNITVTNCSQTDDITLPAGTGFSSNGNTYISQSSVTVPASSFKKGVCQNDGKAGVQVIAQSGGTAYNIPAGSTFKIAYNTSSLSATGDTMSGGTDNIVQSVNQNDINNAKSKIVVDDPSVKKDLANQLTKSGYYPITDTYVATTPVVTTSAKVGEVANTVTVTEQVTYSMYGVKKGDLQKVVEANVKSQIDTSKQSILNDGLARATYNVETNSPTSAQVTMTTTATVGPDLDIDSIKQNAMGKKSGEVKSDLESQPGVKSVTVKLSPFWVSSVPNKDKKITVIIAKPAATKSTNNGSNP